MRRTVDVQGSAVVISPLGPPPVPERSSAIMAVTVRDELTRRAPRARLTARLTRPSAAEAMVRIVEDSLIGVAGRPARAFTPSIATLGRVELEVRAQRYITRRLAVEFSCSRRTVASPSGNAIVTLNSSLGLQATQRLLIGTDDGARAEFAVIAALGPLANQVTLVVPLTSPFPAGATVQPLPPEQTLEMHRAAVSIQGRILKKTGTAITPLANADVSVSKLWRTPPGAGAAGTPETPVPGGPVPAAPWAAPIAALWPPLYADMPVGTALDVEDRPADAAMSVKTLLDDVPEGASELRVSDALNLLPNDVLAVDADDPSRQEIVIALQVNLSAAAADWARVRINQPLALLHRRGATVRRLQAAVPSFSTTLNYAAVAGDEVLLFDTTGFAGRHQICLRPPGPPAAAAFQQLIPLLVRSDAQGFYRLPPISRAGKIELYARDSGSSASSAVEFIPDYDQHENQVDVIV